MCCCTASVCLCVRALHSRTVSHRGYQATWTIKKSPRGVTALSYITYVCICTHAYVNTSCTLATDPIWLMEVGSLRLTLHTHSRRTRVSDSTRANVGEKEREREEEGDRSSMNTGGGSSGGGSSNSKSCWKKWNQPSSPLAFAAASPAADARGAFRWVLLASEEDTRALSFSLTHRKREREREREREPFSFRHRPQQYYY